jgi:integrator complex subunit 8
VLKGSIIKNKQFPTMINITGTEPPNCANSDEKFISGLEHFTPTSIEFLNGVLADPEPFKMLIFESFVPLEESSFNKCETNNGQKFDKFVIISKTELKTQIYYDLCAFYIFIKKYDLAKEMAILCRNNLAKLKVESKGKELRFCTITDEDIKGYLLACGIFDDNRPSLLQRFNECLINNRNNLEFILNEDNYRKEIPIICRKLLETNTDPLSNEFVKILALNSIRYLLDSSNVITNDIPFLALRNDSQRFLLLRFFIQV